MAVLLGFLVILFGTLIGMAITRHAEILHRIGFELDVRRARGRCDKYRFDPTAAAEAFDMQELEREIERMDRNFGGSTLAAD